MSTPTIGGSPDPSQIANTTNSLIRDVQGMQDVQVFKDDTGTRRVLMGRGPSGFYGMKVSQEGNDVYDATNDQLVFNSDNNVFKIVQTEVVSQTLVNVANVVASGTQTFDIAHNLGYVPTFLVYLTAPVNVFTNGNLFMLPYSQPASDMLSIFYNFYATCDDTNLTIRYQHRSNTDYSPDSPTYEVRYYLLQETAN